MDKSMISSQTASDAIARIPLIRVEAALAYCRAVRVAPFSAWRLRSSFDWIPERHRFAFASDNG